MCTVVGFAGDGATADIGLQALSGAFDRRERMLYICYDNEAYMNTGIQKSGATPFGARTTTSPGGYRPETDAPKKGPASASPPPTASPMPPPRVRRLCQRFPEEGPEGQPGRRPILPACLRPLPHRLGLRCGQHGAARQVGGRYRSVAAAGMGRGTCPPQPRSEPLRSTGDLHPGPGALPPSDRRRSGPDGGHARPAVAGCAGLGAGDLMRFIR